MRSLPRVGLTPVGRFSGGKAVALQRDLLQRDEPSGSLDSTESIDSESIDSTGYREHEEEVQ
jgi:hypothetical protein